MSVTARNAAADCWLLAPSVRTVSRCWCIQPAHVHTLYLPCLGNHRRQARNYDIQAREAFG